MVRRAAGLKGWTTGWTDVAVAGGGPGGCAAALALRAHAPGLSVALVEASAYGRERIGETLPPPAAEVLAHLGVWDAFAAQGHHPAYGTAAAWGAPVPHENDFLFHVRQVGWHLDRGAFDGMLADQAGRAASASCAGRGCWTRRARGTAGALPLSDGRELRARFLIDATGAGAALARRRGGGRLVVRDRLAGFVRFFRQPGRRGTRTRWWRRSPTAGGTRRRCRTAAASWRA